MRDVSLINSIENQNKHFMFSTSEKSSIYDKMLKNIVEPDRRRMTIWRTRIAGLIPKTHLGYVLHIAFPLQQ
jgi:hypothetical protein